MGFLSRRRASPTSDSSPGTRRSSLTSHIRTVSLRTFGFSPPNHNKLEHDLSSSLEEHRRVIEDLSLRQEQLEGLKEALEATVLEKLALQDRTGAEQALKRKRLYVQEIALLDASRLRLEKVIFDIESAVTQQRTFSALKELAVKHKHVLKQFDPDRGEKLMQEMDQGQAMQMKMAQMIQNNSVTDDKSSIDAELAELELLGNLCANNSVPQAYQNLKKS